MQDQQKLFVEMALGAWNTYVQRADKLFNTLTDEQLLKEIAPGRNRGIYLLGHLATVSDGLFTLFSLGDKLYPQLETPFLKNPDKPGEDKYTVAELKKYWNDINEKLTSHFNQMSSASWFEKHSAVSAEDFAKEPIRNKLNVLLNRTNHLSYHYGQLILILKNE